jgi:hypothetical protein
VTETLDRIQFYNGYLDARTGKYEWRCQRYDAVIRKLYEMGLENGDHIVDVGAGRQEFHTRLKEWGWKGAYTPLDASIDGIDLEEWTPDRSPDFYVAIEILEHLHTPMQLADLMADDAAKGVAATTPNPYTTDVLGMDPTHVIEVFPEDFAGLEWNTQISSFYGQEDDSILAWRAVDNG